MNKSIYEELKFLLKHSSVYGLGTIIGQTVGFLLLPLYTRYLTPEDYGVLSLINITMDIAGIVAGLGIIASMARFYYEFDTAAERNLVISTIYWISFAVTVIFLPLLYLGSSLLSLLIFKSHVYTTHFRIASFALIFGIISDMGLTYYRVQSKSVIFIQFSLAGMLLSIGLNIYFVVFARTGVIGIFYSSLIKQVILALILSVLILARTGLQFSGTLASGIIRFSFPLIFSNIFRVLVNESDKFFINYFFSPFTTGIYAIAQKIGNSIHQLVISPFLQTYMPRRFEIMKQKDASKTYGAILHYYLVVICSAGLALALFSSIIVRLMTTEQYHSAARYIPLAVLSVIIFGLKYHFETGIMIQKQTKYIAYINGVSALTNVALNFVLISRYQLWGALLALNISYSLTAVLNYIISQKMSPIDFPFPRIEGLMIIVLATFLISLLNPFQSIALNLATNMGIFGLYLLTLLHFRLVNKDGLKAAVFEIFRR